MVAGRESVARCFQLYPEADENGDFVGSQANDLESGREKLRIVLRKAERNLPPVYFHLDEKHEKYTKKGYFGSILACFLAQNTV